MSDTRDLLFQLTLGGNKAKNLFLRSFLILLASDSPTKFETISELKKLTYEYQDKSTREFLDLFLVHAMMGWACDDEGNARLDNPAVQQVLNS